MAKTPPSCVDLLTEVFGPEKVSNFPDALLETMQTFYEASFHLGQASSLPELEKSYEQGFAEGWDSGCHQAWVDINGENSDKEKAHALVALLTARHRKRWQDIAQGNYSNGVGEIFQRKGGDYGWRVMTKDGDPLGLCDEYYTTELGAKLAAAKATGMDFA